DAVSTLSLADDRHVELRAYGAGDFYGLSGGDRDSTLSSCRGGVAGSGLDVGNLAYAVQRNGCDDGCALANERSHAGFARTLRLAEQFLEQAEYSGSNRHAAQRRQRRADPGFRGRLDSRKDDPQTAKRRDKRGHDRRAKDGDPWHSGMVES